MKEAIRIYKLSKGVSFLIAMVNVSSLVIEPELLECWQLKRTKRKFIFV